MEALFKLARELADSKVWSAGVELARNADIQEQRSADERERVFRVISGPRDTVATVTLSELDELWQCDCGADADPCRHVVATIIAVRQGLPSRAINRASRAQPGQVVYSFSRVGGRLAFARLFAWEERRIPVTASLYEAIQRLPAGTTPVATSREEMQLDHILVGRKEGVLEPKTMRLLLPALSTIRSCELDGQPVSVQPDPLFPCVVVTDDVDGFRIKREVDPLVSEIFENGAAIRGHALCAIEDSGLSADELLLIQGDGSFFPRERGNELAASVLPALSGKIKVEVRSLKLPKARRSKPRIVIETIADDQADKLTVVPHLVYGGPPIAEVVRGRIRHLSTSEVPIRDSLEESRLVRDLRERLHLLLDEAKVFSGEAAINFSKSLKGWETRGGGHALFAPARSLTPIATAAASDLAIEFATADGKRVALESVLTAWRAGANYVQLLDGGGWGTLPKSWLVEHEEALKRLIAARSYEGPLRGHLLSDVTELCDSIGISPPEYFTRLRSGLEKIDEIPDAPVPLDLNASLRDYQRRGVNWIAFLRSYGLNALLADDMGLGKTLQALCVIDGRTLVVAPTSVIHAWREQVRRFRPTLKVSVYHGPTRSIDPTADVTITTYAILRLDSELLASQEFAIAVLDEAQTIRNPDSQVARAAYRLNAQFKLTLSGTPVENSLEDLWSQFHFLNPGLLGTRSEFDDGMARGIRAGDVHAAAKLRKRVTPFILRRLKRDVAKELPPKTEVVLSCDLTPNERSLYEAILSASRSEVIERLSEGQSIFSALEVLLRLRQACCHPALLPGQQAASSSKIELLIERLEVSLGQGHRALIFSQWTSLLDLVEPHLVSSGISFSRIDGGTTNRAEVVESFQKPDGPQVMLLSLKAGGVGLTLTAADHVYILDPWWNPAVEDQAADRTHRIGQENPVIVHRLVAQDSIEERILELQNRKRELLSAAIGDSGDVSLSRDELIGLLGH